MKASEDFLSTIRKAGQKLLQSTSNPQRIYTPNPVWYGSDDSILILNAEQARVMAPSLLGQAQDSADLLNKTVSPSVFFERYDFLIGRMDLLAKCAIWVSFSGTPPKAVAKELRTIEKRTAAVDDFLERYKDHTIDKIASFKTLKGKLSNLDKLQTELFSFEDCLSPQQLQSMNSFFDGLREELSTSHCSTNTPSLNTTSNSSNHSLSKEQTFPTWEVSLSFGPSRSPAFQQAVYLWEHAPRHIFLEDPSTIYQCFFSAAPDEFLAYLQLYEIIKGWKTTSILLNGKLVDKKTMAKINYCYGDKCRCGKERFCFGASYYSENPFGCHRLQIESYRNPWYSYSHRSGNRFVIDKGMLKKAIEENSTEYRLCPSFNMDAILKRLDELPDTLTLQQMNEMDPYFGTSAFK